MKVKKGYFLFVLVLTSVVTISWIIFSVYQTTVTSTISEKVSIEINPIKPEFDLKTLEKLKKREQAIPQYQAQSVLVLPPRVIENSVPNATGGANLKL